LPVGSRRKGDRDFIVQGLRITPPRTCERLAVRITAQRERLVGTLLGDLYGGYFDPELRRYLRDQHHHCQVT
jgi:hypothetical protein